MSVDCAYLNLDDEIESDSDGKEEVNDDND
jgi:hypothetical protein